MDNRAVTPVVEKAITMGVVVLFVGGMTTTLFAGVVPTYRDAVGSEMAERTLAMAAEEIERAVPPNATAVRSTRRVDLPPTIRGAGYAIRVDGGELVLDHPRSGVGGRTTLALPPRVTRIDGSWASGGETVVTSRRDGTGLVLELREESP